MCLTFIQSSFGPMFNLKGHIRVYEKNVLDNLECPCHVLDANRFGYYHMLNFDEWIYDRCRTILQIQQQENNFIWPG